MVISELSKYWKDKELEWGRKIGVNEVAKHARLDWSTVNALKEGSTKRYDSHVVGGVCEFFGIADGDPVPFLVVRREGAN